ncbi:hypothetical protein [Undibacterium sp. RuRC25W]|uniref:hypothetical protein n=1 Tax=Undibacterium sp. RuRC25W TaxID=3413047 RepID=UPI003BF24E82
MKKGFFSSATATVATPATYKIFESKPVAKVADVAVANHASSKKILIEGQQIPAISELLALFRVDLAILEIAEGYPLEEVSRTLNLAFVFIRDDHLPFDDAMTLAAEIVVHCPMAECELNYVDVLNLWSVSNAK